MQVNAQVGIPSAGDYRSIITGALVNWGDASTWERYDGASWVTATVAPDFNDGVITVRSPTYIRLYSDLTIDQTIVENGATIQPSQAGTTLTINNGPGTDLELNGANATVWANNHLLNVTSGALIDGPLSSMAYRGLTIINNGTINAQLNPRPDVASTTISGTGTIATLKISNNGGFFLAGEQTITDFLNFEFGNVITGPNKLILATTGVIQNLSLTDWFVNGNLQMNFPVGNNTKDYRIGDANGYRPVSITLNNVTGSGGVIASTTTGDHPNISNTGIIAGKSVNRWWSFNNTGLNFSSASATMNWDPSEVDAGAIPANFKVGKFSTSWSYPTVLNPTATSITATNNTSFSDFIVGEAAPIVNIPDANFKAALVGNNAINTNLDSEIQVSEAIAYNSGIDVNTLNIADLTGIEAFTSLTSLTCYNNTLTTLNVSANTNLTYLSCFQNQLTSLDLSNNTQLTSLLFSYNQIPTIDLTANTALTFLVCDNGALTTLDVSANTGLTFINCSVNPSLASLNIQNGNNANLTFFNATQSPSLSCIQVDDLAI